MILEPPKTQRNGYEIGRRPFLQGIAALSLRFPLTYIPPEVEEIVGYIHHLVKNKDVQELYELTAEDLSTGVYNTNIRKALRGYDRVALFSGVFDAIQTPDCHSFNFSPLKENVSVLVDVKKRESYFHKDLKMSEMVLFNLEKYGKNQEWRIVSIDGITLQEQSSVRFSREVSGWIKCPPPSIPEYIQRDIRLREEDLIRILYEIKQVDFEYLMTLVDRNSFTVSITGSDVFKGLGEEEFRGYFEETFGKSTLATPIGYKIKEVGGKISQVEILINQLHRYLMATPPQDGPTVLRLFPKKDTFVLTNVSEAPRGYYDMKEYTPLPNSEQALGISEQRLFPDMRISSGSILVEPGGTFWYVRNNARYKIGNSEDLRNFRQSTRITKGTFQLPTNKEIPIGEEPERQGDLFEDWDGRLLEWQANDGRMLMLLGPFGSTTKTAVDKFSKLEDYLSNRGWRNRIIYATLNVRREGNRIIPDHYTEEHSAETDPLITLDRLDLLMERYKRLFPRTRFELGGYSYGGYLALNLALRHPDAVRTVISFNSPLTGLDKPFGSKVPIVGILIEEIEKVVGPPVAKHLIELADDPLTKRRVESRTREHRRRGGRMFSMSNIYDALVNPKNAVLEYSNKEVRRREIKLLREIPPDLDETGHSQIMKDTDVFEDIYWILEN